MFCRPGSGATSCGAAFSGVSRAAWAEAAESSKYGDMSLWSVAVITTTASCSCDPDYLWAGCSVQEDLGLERISGRLDL
jgi:hypothetical protein